MQKSLQLVLNSQIKEFPLISAVLSPLNNSNALIRWTLNCVSDYILSHKEELSFHLENLEEFLATAKLNFRDSDSKSSEKVQKIIAILKEYFSLKESGFCIEDQNLEPEIQEGLKQFQSFSKEHDLYCLAFSLPVFHPKLDYADFLDALAIVDNELCLLDFHCANACYPVHELRAAARLKAFSYLIDQKISFSYLGKTYNYQDFSKPLGTKIIYIQKNPVKIGFKNLILEDDQQSFIRQKNQMKAFEGLLKYYQYSKGLKSVEEETLSSFV